MQGVSLADTSNGPPNDIGNCIGPDFTRIMVFDTWTPLCSLPLGSRCIVLSQIQCSVLSSESNLRGCQHSPARTSCTRLAKAGMFGDFYFDVCRSSDSDSIIRCTGCTALCLGVDAAQ